MSMYSLRAFLALAVLYGAAILLVGCNKEEAAPQSQPAPPTGTTDGDGNYAAKPAPAPYDGIPPDNLQQEAAQPFPGHTFTGPRLGDIPVGKSVWIEPWTVWVAAVGENHPNRVFVNGTHNYYEQQRPGTIEITMQADGTWLVDLHGSAYQWTAMKFPNFEGGGYDSQPVRFRH